MAQRRNGEVAGRCLFFSVAGWQKVPSARVSCFTRFRIVTFGTRVLVWEGENQKIIQN